MTKCKDCKCWRMSHTIDNYGECRRKSPSPSGGKDDCTWPTTHIDDECEEGKAQQVNDGEWSVPKLKRLKRATESCLEQGHLSSDGEKYYQRWLELITDKLIALDPEATKQQEEDEVDHRSQMADEIIAELKAHIEDLQAEVGQLKQEKETFRRYANSRGTGRTE